jgi:hypothetical protein
LIPLTLRISTEHKPVWVHLRVKEKRKRKARSRRERNKEGWKRMEKAEGL